MAKKIVKIEDIDLEYRKTQVRCGIDQALVEQYAEVWIDNGPGDSFRFDETGPITLFTAGGRCIVAAGWHRIFAAIKAGRKSVPVELLSGTKDDALWFALADNLKHGKQLTREDRRKMIDLAIRTFPDKLPTTIANHIQVSHNTVFNRKAQLEENAKAEAKKAEPAKVKHEPKFPQKKPTPRPDKMPRNTPAPSVQLSQEIHEAKVADEIDVLDAQINSLFGNLGRALDDRVNIMKGRPKMRQWHGAVVGRLREASEAFEEWRKVS